jgi:alginate O-acetyltransferase complex protein AlgI
MTEFVLRSMVWMLAMTALFWAMPARWRMDWVALASGVFLLWWSPATAAVLLGTTVIVWLAARGPGSRAGWDIPFAMGLIGLGSLVLREAVPMASTVHFTGGAYCVLRHLHLLAEVRLGRVPPPSLRNCLRYQFFLPVIGAGPIHRFQNHLRERERHRWDKQRFASGAERVLYGTAKICVVGDYLLARKVGFHLGAPNLVAPDGMEFFHLWLVSAVEWLHLYVQFGGLSDIAIGFAGMMGFRIEENFNRPWQARDLLDFWSRWHMTLSSWCRDYVYLPVSAWTRRPALGLLAAMLAIGLWHDTSLYYGLWSCYHAVGIAGTRLLRRARLAPSAGETDDRRSLAHRAMAAALLLAWLAAARPVITLLFGIPR